MWSHYSVPFDVNASNLDYGLLSSVALFALPLIFSDTFGNRIADTKNRR